ncbi:MAG: major capsid protein [Microviridae sp.]|nr:MAG: major capsid protein [Microviridae sp.]
MARQNTTPVQFQRQQRRDDSILMTSGRAGVVTPIGYIPILRGDSGSGQVGIDVELGQMPRPLLNAATANVQAWFVPKSIYPQFTGKDDFRAAYQGNQIVALGASPRDAPPYMMATKNSTEFAAVGASTFAKTLGLHLGAYDSGNINVDLIDAFNLVYNFRLAAHSSRIERKKYFAESASEALALPRAFWPSGRFSRVVPDYERALIVGSLDLDVTAGQIPIWSYNKANIAAAGDKQVPSMDNMSVDPANGGPQTKGDLYKWSTADDRLSIFAEMRNTTIGTTLADIDKARQTQAFAKLRSSYAGNEYSGFDNDNTLVAELMQGFVVDADEFNRPVLLDSKRVTFGMAERHATDGTNLDKSVTQGRASATLSLNLPQVDTGGVIVFTLEVLPERLDERQSDEWLFITDPSGFPDALRDVQRPEPVDMVLNRRLDAAHTLPNALYGYEAMNDVWNRSTTRLGGAFYQADPTNPFSEQRSAIWQTSIVDPTFTKDHWLAPANFPHDVFADSTAPAFEAVVRHTFSIVGLTQIGDVLVENNDDYAGITEQE